MKLTNVIKRFFLFHKKLIREGTFKPVYRIVEILQNQQDSYFIRIQLINKNVIFDVDPIEVLAHDEMVDKFSPRDIRTITYIAYLGLNTPKYKIVSQRIIDIQSSFTIKEICSSKIIVKSVQEILHDPEIFSKLSPKDMQLLAYSSAMQKIQDDRVKNQELLQ